MQVVGAVAIGANGCIDDAVGVGNAVDALFVAHNDGALTEIEFLHFLNVAVAFRARVRNVGAVYGRSRISIIEQLVRVAVTILAGSRLRHAFVNRLAVIAIQIDVGFDPVALAATDRLMRFRVRQVGYVGMTARAKILRVDGRGVFLFVNEKRDHFAGGVALGQRRVGVANKAIRIVDGSGVLR